MGGGLSSHDKNMLGEASMYYVFEKDTDGKNVLVGSQYARDFEEYKNQLREHGAVLDLIGKNKIPKDYRSIFEPYYSKTYRLLTEEEFNKRRFDRTKQKYTDRLKIDKQKHPDKFSEILNRMKLGTIWYYASEPGCPMYKDCDWIWQESKISENEKPAAIAAAEEFESRQTAGKRCRSRNTKRRYKKAKKTRRR